jgi:hypothetical protein
MKAVTLRKLPPEVARAIRHRAGLDRSSLNKAAISLLAERAGVTKPRALHHDLDSLAGTWTKQEAGAFDRTLKKQRTIDPTLWR